MFGDGIMRRKVHDVGCCRMFGESMSNLESKRDHLMHARRSKTGGPKGAAAQDKFGREFSRIAGEFFRGQPQVAIQQSPQFRLTTLPRQF